MATCAGFREPALTVVMAAKGYPGDYRKGTRSGDSTRREVEGVEVFHAGTGPTDGHMVATAAAC